MSSGIFRMWSMGATGISQLQLVSPNIVTNIPDAVTVF